MTLAEALRVATARLARAGIEGAARDARLLLAAALDCPADRLTLRLGERLAPGPAARLDAMVAERAARRPLSQIVGRRIFWGRDFRVTGDVLDPRPETETIIAAALARGPAARILDLGTGSGAILLTLLAEWPEATGLGTDTSEAALAVAATNASALGLAGRARFCRADWTDGLRARFDLVVCNPPYIPEAEIAGLAPEVRDWEPRAALTAGPTGLEAYRRLAAGLPGVMAAGATALLEFGEGQGAAIAALFGGSGLALRGFHRDLDGRARVIEFVAPAA